MIRHLRAGVIASVVLVGVSGPALAQKQGGILKVYHRDSPTSMSILEEATISTALPIMGVFNNLVVYDRNVEQNSLHQSSPISRRAGSSARTEPSSPSNCEKASNPDYWKAGRPAIRRGPSAKAGGAGLGHRQEAARGCRAPDHLSQPGRDLLAAPAEGAHPDGQQHL